MSDVFSSDGEAVAIVVTPTDSVFSSDPTAFNVETEGFSVFPSAKTITVRAAGPTIEVRS